MLRAAPAGTGIIAGGPMRAVFETLGVQDVVAKSLGSSNPYNMVRATFDALKREDSPRGVAAKPRQEGRRRSSRAAATSTPTPAARGVKAMARMTEQAGKTVTVEQIGSPIRRPTISARP